MKTCAACRKEVQDDANFCGWCGFRMTPIPATDLDTLTRELKPIKEDNPVLLTKMKKVQGKGEQGWAELQRREQVREPPEKPEKPRLEVVDHFAATQPAASHPATIDLDRPRARQPSEKMRQALAPTLGGSQPVRRPAEPPEPAPPVVAQPAEPVELKPARGLHGAPPIPADALEPSIQFPPIRESEEIPALDPAHLQQEQPQQLEQPEPATEAQHDREYRRFPISVEVGYASEHNFYTGFMENLSSGGLFVATHDPTEIGDVLEITFSVPGLRRTCTAMCVVQWIRDYNPDMADMIPGMGLKFVEIDPEARAAIELFIKHREPIFFE